ncbi:hypothetical protein GQ600_3732 [Phytophthora cactorum]|nr:hypothetical protein GQ600_3732 [Phytophthora cactorum]
MFKKQVRAAAQCTARKSTENIFYVDDAAVSVEEGIGECSDSALTYTVIAYGQAFQHAAIILPFVPALLSESLIQPPPLYNQAGTRSRNVRRDVASREKRIPSRGEPKSSKSNQLQKKSTNSSIDQSSVSSEILDDEIRGYQKKKRRKYNCSRCGFAEGHNAANCPNRSNGAVDSDIKPGIYIVGGCPFELHQRRITCINPQVEIPEIISEYIF